MDGSIWLYLAEVVALAVVAAIVVGLRRPSVVEKSRPCPNSKARDVERGGPDAGG